MGKRNGIQGLRMFLFFLAGVIGTLFLGLTARAAAVETSGGAASTNLHKHEYTWYYLNVPRSFLYLEGEDIFRVEAIGDKVVIEKYSSQYEFVSSKEITNELPIFGGFYHGANYNFLVFGQNNPNDSDSVEIMRVVKYDANWNKLGSVSYYGCNTYAPFDAGSMSFAEYGDLLYIRTCHEMYKSDDGYHHQACMTFSLRQSDLSKVDQYSIVMNASCGYVSHSFNQYIRIVGNKVVAVDHGDAYPRSIVLGQYSKDASLGNVSTYGGYTYVNLLTIPGEIGDNYTGVNVGGFEVSSTHYLVAVNSVDLSLLGSAKVKNVKLLIQPVGNFGSDATVIRDVTSYDENGTTSVSNPYLVPMEDDTFALIWEETGRPSGMYSSGSYYNRVMIQTLDHNGNAIGETKQVEGSLSDCTPIYFNGKLVWYVTKGKAPVFHEIVMKEQGDELQFHFLHNIEFDNNIAMHYAIKKADLEGCSDLKLVIDKEHYDENVATPTVQRYELENPATLVIEGVEYWHFIFPGICAPEMGNKIEATLSYVKDGVNYVTAKEAYSVEAYAYDRLENSNSDSYKKILVDMLNYGAAAQYHFRINADHPVNAKLADYEKYVSSWSGVDLSQQVENVTELTGATASFNGKNLSFDNKVVLLYGLNFTKFLEGVSSDKTAEKMANVKVKFTYDNGKEQKSQTIPYSKLQSIDGRLAAYCDVIAPAEMGCMVSATIYDGETPISNTIQYSIEAYAKDRLENNSTRESYKDLMRMMVLYGRAVKKHFG